MKYKKKLDKLATRQAAFDRLDNNTKAALNRPGSQKK